MRQGITAYVMEGQPTGGFLKALLSNDFMAAAGKADDANLAALAGWAKFLYNYAPGGCHGSPEIYQYWVDRGGLKGLTETDA